MTISSVINIVSATPAGTYSLHQNRISPASIEKYGSGVRRVIDSSVAYGLPEPTIPHKPNSRLQKYRLAQSKAHP